MDGLKGKLTSSLQFKLSAWLTLVIVGVAMAAGVFSFNSAFEEANELQDDQLRQIAAVLRRQNIPLTQPTQPSYEPGIDPDSLVVLQVLPNADQGKPSQDGASIAFPLDMKDGIQTVTADQQSWRVVVETLDSGQRIVIGQRTSTRDEIARDGAQHTLLPFMLLIPLLLLLVGELIRKTIKPVRHLAQELDKRSQEDLRELSATSIPTEIQPFVVSINRLLARVSQSMVVQRRFLADAAHELRTPLTALTLQAERLDSADISEEARGRLVALQDGLKRSRLLLDQLLALARVQDTPPVSLQPVSVRSVFLNVSEDLIPLAEVKNIDLGMVGEQDYTVLATEFDLRTLVRNLVDNAIRYTPTGGKIDLSVGYVQGRVELTVSDTGPGIAEEERKRVFDPFYRVLGNDEVGSGLGLSIVQAIALRIEAQVHLGYTNPIGKTGLRVIVSF